MDFDADKLHPGVRAVLALRFAFVDTWRMLIRPALTSYLTVIVTLLFYTVVEMLETLGVVMDADTAYKIVLAIVSAILYVWTTCALWWFGSRNKQSPTKGLG